MKPNGETMSTLACTSSCFLSCGVAHERHGHSLGPHDWTRQGCYSFLAPQPQVVGLSHFSDAEYVTGSERGSVAGAPRCHGHHHELSWSA